jgi:aspartate/methionine/tyrosine aminotransferase
LIADTYLSPGTPVQHAAAALLEAGEEVRREIMARLHENLAFLRAAVESRPHFGLLDVEGGWCATLRVPRTMNEEDWVLALLEQDNVLVQPGYFYDFDMEAFLVLSLITPAGTFREGLTRLLARDLG